MSADAVVAALFLTSAGRQDPHPRCHRLREIVHRSEVERGYIISGYDESRAARRDPRFEERSIDVLDSISDHWRDRPAVEWLSETMLQAEPPAHTSLRRKVVRCFTPRTIEALRPLGEHAREPASRRVPPRRSTGPSPDRSQPIRSWRTATWGKARTATVTADTHLPALAISSDRFTEVMTINPIAGGHMRGLTAASYREPAPPERSATEAVNGVESGGRSVA